MTKRMLVDATHPEETRVAIVDSYRDVNRLEDLDYDLASKRILKGNIYLAKVVRVEPSLQAAFVEYGGNRHGFLPFTEIHPDYFRIPVADRPHDEEPESVEPERFDTAQSDEQVAELKAEQAEQAAEARGETPLETPVDARAVATEQSFGSPVAEAAVVDAAVQPQPESQSAMLQPPLSTYGFAAHFGTETDVGLITDFGSAVVSHVAQDAAPEQIIQQEPTPVESVGGEVAERFVRQPRIRYKIQEVLNRGQVMLVQVVKEERGNKGAALTSFLSLAGRYCVLMPNTDHGGGVSRKITSHQDRRRMKEILDELEVPEGMAVILRTAGMEQALPDIKRDQEYLMRMWNNIREQTLQSTAPSLIYEEADLIKRSVRDLFTQDIAEILVSGAEGYNRAREFMRNIMPDQVEKIRLYNDPVPLFFRYQVENQIDGLHSPTVQLRSGGYIVINPTEALVSIDVNSGRATRERHIEETALKTNLEASDEIARQLRLRDLAGLVVIDFIDMEDGRNNTAVERRLKDAMKNDRARLQLGRISPFGLMELSRQRLRPSLLEINFEKCPHCAGIGLVRSADSAALSILRAIEEEGIRQRSAELVLHVHTRIALYILNQKRDVLTSIEQRYNLHVLLHSDDTLVPPDYRLERSRQRKDMGRKDGPAVNSDQILAETGRDLPPEPMSRDEGVEPYEGGDLSPSVKAADEAPASDGRRRFREGSGTSRRGRGRGRQGQAVVAGQGAQPVVSVEQPRQSEFVPDGTSIVRVPVDNNGETEAIPAPEGGAALDADGQQRRRRRGRRGGRRRGGEGVGEGGVRSPRDPNAPDSSRWRQNTTDEVQQQAYAPDDMPPVIIPKSIHEIDTTPKEIDTRPSSPSPHETVNPESDSPKGGWWRRLTGQ